jgi:cephalosporin hydroxylase
VENHLRTSEIMLGFCFPWDAVADCNEFISARLYQRACTINSDIVDHIPRMNELAQECNHITECGVRFGTSSAAWLHSSAVLRSYDIEISPEARAMFDAAKAAGRNAILMQKSSIEIDEPEPTDLLFLDTDHTYGLLRRELALWHLHVRKYIVLHDTTTYAYVDQNTLYGPMMPEDKQGLWPAVEEFLAEHPEWFVKERYEHCNGLTVLARS